LAQSGLFVSLFVDWRSAPGNGNSLVLFGALDRIGGFFASGNRSGWDAYPLASALLAALAVVSLAAALLERHALRMIAAMLTIGALVFTIHALLVGPGFAGSRVPIGGAAPEPAVLRRLVFAWSTAGPGVTLAIVALTIATLGFGLAVAPATPKPVDTS
jgi:hypothetical protein